MPLLPLLDGSWVHCGGLIVPPVGSSVVDKNGTVVRWLIICLLQGTTVRNRVRMDSAVSGDRSEKRTHVTGQRREGRQRHAMEKRRGGWAARRERGRCSCGRSRQQWEIERRATGGNVAVIIKKGRVQRSYSRCTETCSGEKYRCGWTAPIGRIGTRDGEKRRCECGQRGERGRCSCRQSS